MGDTKWLKCTQCNHIESEWYNDQPGDKCSFTKNCKGTMISFNRIIETSEYMKNKLNKLLELGVDTLEIKAINKECNKSAIVKVNLKDFIKLFDYESLDPMAQLFEGIISTIVLSPQNSNEKIIPDVSTDQLEKPKFD